MTGKTGTAVFNTWAKAARAASIHQRDYMLEAIQKSVTKTKQEPVVKRKKEQIVKKKII